MNIKYVVLKVEEIEKYCSFEQLEQLEKITNEVQAGRVRDNKEEDNFYFVVNTKEPYANKVKKLIEKNEGVKIEL